MVSGPPPRAAGPARDPGSRRCRPRRSGSASIGLGGDRDGPPSLPAEAPAVSAQGLAPWTAVDIRVFAEADGTFDGVDLIRAELAWQRIMRTVTHAANREAFGAVTAVSTRRCG